MKHSPHLFANITLLRKVSYDLTFLCVIFHQTKYTFHVRLLQVFFLILGESFLQISAWFVYLFFHLYASYMTNINVIIFLSTISNHFDVHSQSSHQLLAYTFIIYCKWAQNKFSLSMFNQKIKAGNSLHIIFTVRRDQICRLYMMNNVSSNNSSIYSLTINLLVYLPI